MEETPNEWAGRNRRQFLKSTKETLGGEMWFAVKFNVSGTFLFMIGIIIGIAVNERWAYGVMGATFLVFGVSLYWAWYIRRSINRRWEKEMAARAFAKREQETAITKPPTELMQKRPVDDTEIRRLPGPQRGFGYDE